ncbi:Hypothetical predicted protein [Pelobates cultripes]|nr:Hypothetical predicted protein [Pelobates cultripes]
MGNQGVGPMGAMMAPQPGLPPQQPGMRHPMPPHGQYGSPHQVPRRTSSASDGNQTSCNVSRWPLLNRFLEVAYSKYGSLRLSVALFSLSKQHFSYLLVEKSTHSTASTGKKSLTFFYRGCMEKERSPGEIVCYQRKIDFSMGLRDLVFCCGFLSARIYLGDKLSRETQGPERKIHYQLFSSENRYLGTSQQVHPFIPRFTTQEGENRGLDQSLSPATLTNEEERSKGIFNLTGIPLTSEEIDLLSKGMKFAPNKKVNDFDLYIDLKKFIRSLTIKRHFLLHPSTTEREIDTVSEREDYRFQPKSNFFPVQSKGPFLETFEHMVDQAFQSIAKKRKSGSCPFNLTKREEATLKHLMEREDLVIREADKGGELKEILTTARDNGIISLKNFDFLFQKSPVIPIFYFLPKTHKRLPDPPGRPIISGVNSLTANLSAYVDSFLQKYAQGAPSFIRDTKSFLQELDSIEWDPEYSWATLDVTSLYTGQIQTKCFFKPTDGNGFVHQQSCHHKPWLRGIARSQFTRLRRNCSRPQDFQIQSSHIKNKLCARGYNKNTLEKEIRSIGLLERNKLLEDKPPNTVGNKNFKSAFVTQYNTDHFKIKRSLKILSVWVSNMSFPTGGEVIGSKSYPKGKPFGYTN